MKKSVLKRIRITRTGKVLRRSMAIDHFRTRKSGKNLAHKRRLRSLEIPRKTLLNY